MCALLHPVQVMRWSLQRSQESPVTGRQILQFRQCTGDAQVDQVFRVDSVKEEAEAQRLKNQYGKTQENVGNTKKYIQAHMCRFEIFVTCSVGIQKDTAVNVASHYPNESHPGTQR